MKKLKSLLYSIGLLTLLGACSSEQDVATQANDVLSFDSNITPATTRVKDNKFEVNDAIGIFAYKAGTEEQFTDKLNLEHKLNSEKLFIPTPGNEIKLNGIDEAVDIIAYYPYTDQVQETTYSIDLGTEAVDLLYATKLENVSIANPKLIFKHRLASISLTLSIKEDAANEITSLAGLTVSDVDGVQTKASLDLLKDKLTLDPAAATPKVTFNAEEKTATLSFMVLPGQDISKIRVPFVLDNHTYEWSPELTDGTTEIKESTIYRFKGTFFKADQSITLEPITDDTTIGDWGVNEGKDKELNPKEDTPEPEGSLDVEGEKELTIIASGVQRAALTVKASEGLVWEVASDLDWITVEKSDAEPKVIYDVLENTTAEKRTGTITLTAQDIAPVVVTIHQDGQSVDPVEQTIFEEKFGDKVLKKPWITLSEYTDFDNADFVFTDLNSSLTMRALAGFNSHVWMPNAGDSGFTIEGFRVDGFSDLKLVFNLMPSAPFDLSVMNVYCDSQRLDIVSKEVKGQSLNLITIENLPADFSVLKFEISSTDNPNGLRVGNIKLTGMK